MRRLCAGRIAVVVACALLALCSGLAWWLWSAAPSADGVLTRSQDIEAPHPMAVSPASAAVPTRDSDSTLSNSIGDARSFVCPPTAARTAVAEERPPSAEETAQVLRRLESSDQTVDALAALSLRAALQVETEFNASSTVPARCAPGDSGCSNRTQQRYQELTHAVHAASAGRASALALRSGEPAALQIALHLCAALPTAERVACHAPLLRAWTAREPDNATPWLMLAASEREHGDTQASAEALYRASQAQRVSDGSQGLWGVLAGPGLGPQQGAAAADLQMRWAALIAGMNYISLGNVAELCGDAALRDGNQRQSCEALARRMVNQGSSLVHRVEGLALAHRLGWPEDELLALRQRVHRLLKADSDDLQTQASLDVCQTVQWRQTRAQQLAQHGEVSRLETQLAGPPRRP